MTKVIVFYSSSCGYTRILLMDGSSVMSQHGRFFFFPYSSFKLILLISTPVSLLYSVDNLVSRVGVLWGHIAVGLTLLGGESGKINKKQEARAAVIFSDCHHLSLNALPETVDLMGAQTA